MPKDSGNDGGVITFSDVTGAKKMETELRATEAGLRALLEKQQGKLATS